MFSTLINHLVLPKSAPVDVLARASKSTLGKMHNILFQNAASIFIDPLLSRELLVIHRDFKREIARPNFNSMRQINPHKDSITPLNVKDEWFALFAPIKLPHSEFEIRCLTRAQDLEDEGMKSTWCYGRYQHSRYLNACKTGMKHIMVITKNGENKASVELIYSGTALENAIQQGTSYWKQGQFFAPGDTTPLPEVSTFWSEIFNLIKNRTIPINPISGLNPEHPSNGGKAIQTSSFEELTSFQATEITALYHQLISHYNNRVQVKRDEKIISIFATQTQHNISKLLGNFNYQQFIE